VFSHDLNTNEKFFDFVIVEINRKSSTKDLHLSLNHNKIKTLRPKIMTK